MKILNIFSFPNERAQSFQGVCLVKTKEKKRGGEKRRNILGRHFLFYSCCATRHVLGV